MAASRRVVLLGGLAAMAGCSGAATTEPTPSITPSSTPTPAPTPTPTVAPEPTSIPSPSPTGVVAPSWARPDLPSRASVVQAYAARSPGAFGLEVPGTILRLDRPAGVALTFDACGGAGGGAGYDSELIGTLRRLGVPATLFLNQRWIAANPGITSDLVADPLFEIECHGTRHVPLSLTGAAAYGIAGTSNAGEAYDELTGSHGWFLTALGRPPWFFRSGTAHVDEASAALARELGRQVTNFTVNADCGATAAPAAVASSLLGVRAGDIVIGHMNRPGRGTAAGVAQALPVLLDRGVGFVRLRDGFA